VTESRYPFVFWAQVISKLTALAPCSSVSKSVCGAETTSRHTVHMDESEYVDDFTCTCGVEPDATVAVADYLREDARRILEAGTDDWRPGSHRPELPRRGCRLPQ